MDNVIIKPLLTEKATGFVQNKVYAFVVNNKSNKFQIAKTLERLYKVKIGGVKIIARKGKTRKVGRKMLKKTLPTKKIAYVEVKEGKIDLFPEA